jgi:hypothetical protein
MNSGQSLVAVLALLGLSVVVAACSSSKGSGSANGSGDGGDVVNCDDPRTQTYAANMEVPGQAGLFKFVLVSSDPAPPASETNTWVLQILDSAGNPVDGITGTAVATMPLMSHGTTPIGWTPGGGGSYTLTPLYFFMAGLWEVAIKVQSGGATGQGQPAQTDSVSFYFCVAG